MTDISPGADVVVIERHSYLSYCEGRVHRVTTHDSVPVAIVDLTDEQGRSGRHRLPVSYLGTLPAPGERRRWDDRSPVRTPFTVGERFPDGHRFAGYFRILHDGAPPAGIADGHDAIASAGELAKFSAVIEEPDGAILLGTANQILIQAALDWEADQTEESPIEPTTRKALRAAIRAYRTARDS